ncbi:hypothetical protein PtrM4_044110 [Pyrenophora tritici-repentis]|uniref:Uncharacterized protein n=1 Tax=Pyrenophora tritici-repentis TaxID=45151 RepID=A0A834RN47_9PLEO|nr:hypothetical protein A1F99_109240 [Pyrenophora tritici-repentis]KAF7564977.1 hypothetical protein PtrM4_044110 [Pyrenophora tritici-repentis]KAI0586147.1 hypothetical protein Alg215_02199 [Pyrenophora tritici-repentis]
MKVSLPIIVVASIFARSTAAQIDDPSRAGPIYWGTVIIQDEVNFKNVPYCEVPGQNRFRCPCFEPAVGKEYDCKPRGGTWNAPCYIGGKPTQNNVVGVADMCA